MRRSKQPPKVYAPGDRDRRGVVLYAEVTPAMKRTVRRLSFEWEISQADIIQSALEQYLATQGVALEDDRESE